jgi:HSP20 family molecular chaperone IbpA
MSTLFFERTPFDILVRNFFQDASTFAPLAESKVPHPVDIYQNDHGLVFEIACTGIDKKDLKIESQDNVLRVSYEKPKTDEPKNIDYIHKGVAKRSFNLGWKIDNKFDLKKIVAKYENGLLTIGIPYAKESQIKLIDIV